jgi:hypothetical protein
MSDRKPSQDRRTACRYTVAECRQRCELKVDSHVLSARLVNESASGFAVVVDHRARLHVGQQAQLDTDSGSFAVRVVHIAAVRPTEDDDNPVGEHGRRLRLGLLRLGEVALTDQPTISAWAGSLRIGLNQWSPPGGMLLVLGTFLAAIVVAVLVVWMIGGWYARYFHAQQPLPRSDRLTELAAPGNAPASAQSLRQSGGAAPASNGASGSSSDHPAADHSQGAFGSDGGRTQRTWTSAVSPSSPPGHHDSLSRLPGAAALALPDVVQQLQLTAKQQERIRQLIEATSQAMRNLDQRVPGQQRQQVSAIRARLLDEARREALGLLTSQQRAEWEKLAGGQ